MTSIEWELLEIEHALERVEELRGRLQVLNEGSDNHNVREDYIKPCIHAALNRALRTAKRLVKKAESHCDGLVGPAVSSDQEDPEVGEIIRVLRRVSDAWTEIDFIIKHREERLRQDTAEENSILLDVLRGDVPELASKAIGPGRSLVKAIRQLLMAELEEVEDP